MTAHAEKRPGGPSRRQRIEQGPRLSREQLEQFRAAWSTFGHPDWQPFRRACLERGFWPPDGDVDDEDDGSLRARLRPIADARPAELGRWVAESQGRNLHEVIGEVFERFGRIRDQVERRELEWEATKREEAAAAGAAVARLGIVVGPAREG